MKIHEYQAKELLEKFKVPIPKGGVATSAHEAYQIAEGLGGDRFVVKAQIHDSGYPSNRTRRPAGKKGSGGTRSGY
jgi:succinyl-CoA synthetase beta subunit